VAYRAGKNGTYELKKPLRNLFRIIPEQEESSSTEQTKDSKNINPEELIED